MATGDDVVGSVAELWRYPVKSLGGERVSQVDVDERGLRGDRLWSVRDEDGKFGSGKSTRRFRRMDGLLMLTAQYDGDVPVIRFPDGRVHRGDDADVDAVLSEHVGRKVSIGREENVSHFDEGPLHLVTEASLAAMALARGAAVEVRRFRANLVLDTGDAAGFVEESWIGRRLAIGPSLVIEIGEAMPRCVMVTMPQADLPADDDLLKDVTRANNGCIGVVADVVVAGAVAVGDRVCSLD